MREGLVANLSRKIVLLTWSPFLFLALLSIINRLHITYYPVVHRANIESIIHVVLISDHLDSALVILFAALSSFFTFLAFQRLSGNKWLASSPLIILNLSALLAAFVDFDLALVLVVVGVSSYIILAAKALRQIIDIVETILVICCILEAGSLVHWLLFPFVMPSWFTDLLSHLSAIETQLFYAPTDFTPIVMLILLFSYPLFTIVNKLRKGSAESKRDDTASPRLDLCLDGRILLVVALFVTAFITSYPYLPSINPTGKYVGTDIYYYSKWLGEMELNPSQAVEFAVHHSSSRPLFLILLYSLKLLFRMPTIPFLEWIAVPIFCLLPVSVYCFGTVANGRAFAGLVALLSSFSINIVAGIYTAYYSNILALSMLYLALAFLLFALKGPSYPLTALSCVLSILTNFIHPWTWAFILVALLLYVGICILHGIIILHSDMFSTMNQLWLILVFIAANIMADLIKSLLLAVPSGVGISYDIASAKIGFGEFLRLGFNLNFTFKFFAGGYFNNLSALVLAIVGSWWLTRQKGSSRGILLAWLSMGTIPTLFVDFWLNERIFYVLPIQVLSTAGLWFLSSPSNLNRKFLPKVLISSFILLNLNYALRSVASLV